MDTRDLVFSVNQEWQNHLKKYPWVAFVSEEAKNSGILYIRNLGSSVVYKKVGDGFKCVTCGSEIQSARVFHPIWDEPFTLSMAREIVPYCPKCEKVPSREGMPMIMNKESGLIH